jgi:EAL domain-containing protein (putative c-di-GMP-specific phosphodiesterase class I)
MEAGARVLSSFPHVVLSDPLAGDASMDTILQDALHAIRSHLDMDVAFISEFSKGRRYFRYVESAPDKHMVAVGNSDLLAESYCYYIVDGRLPRLMQDAALNPFARTMPVTESLPVGAHISVPIILSDGRIYGTFCCFKTIPDPSLRDRDLALVTIFAEFTAKQLERWLLTQHAQVEMAERVQSVIASRHFTVVYQPIYDFIQERIVGFESLARFSTMPIQPPNVWFDEAARVGLVEALEVAVIQEELKGLRRLPRDVYVSLNVSPITVMSGALDTVLQRVPLDRVVLEITEHVSIADYAQVAKALQPLRNKGLRLAVDDAGAGYASFRHILSLEPDIIKLDMSLTRDIDTDGTRRALAAALIRFGEETGSRIIAEGVETASELSTLRQLRITKIQGYLIGRPGSLTSAAKLVSSA